MNRTTTASIVAIIAIAELLLVSLLLPAERWHANETVLAFAGAFVAWVVTIALTVGQASSAAGSASTLTKWPSVAAGFGWSLLSALPIRFAVEMTTKWVLGAHALAGLACAGVWVLMRDAGRHVDDVEAAIAQTDNNHRDLNSAIARTQSLLTRAVLNPEMSQRARTLLDRAQTVPRSALLGAAGEDLVILVRQVGLAAGEGPEAVGAPLVALEDAVVKIRS